MRAREIYFLLFVSSLCICLYYPGLSGPFIFDDVSNISDNDLLKVTQFSIEDLWQASLSSESGPLKRPIAMFSFAINHIFTGMDPWWMKLTNLGIHLLNGLILFLVLQQLFAGLQKNKHQYASMLPSLVTIIWLVHPINVTAVSYIVQRMTSLSATFVLLALYCYLKLREGKLVNWRGYLLGCSVLFFWLLGLLSKEAAILLSIYIFVIEWCVYGFKTGSKNEKKHLGMLWTLLAVPWACAFIYVIYEPSYILRGYNYRDFTLIERLLTECRIVIDYLRLIIIPDIRHMGLYQDNVVLSKSLLEPISTLFSILLIIGLLILAIRVRRKAPLFSMGILWFFGGHVLESSVFPLELVFLHRNYLPSIGIILVLSEAGCFLFQNYRRLVIATTCAVILGFSICTHSLTQYWSGDYRMSLLEVMNNPESVRANLIAGQVYNSLAMISGSDIERIEYRKVAEKYFRKVHQLDPRDITGELNILEIVLRSGEPPTQLLLDNIIAELPTGKIRSRTTNVFNSIIRCLIKEGCSLPERDFDRLILALLSNPGIAGRQRGELLGNYAAYILAIENDLDEAISIVLQAIGNEPSMLELYELLIYYYGKTGNTKDIKRAINILENKDRFGRFRKYIRQARVEVDASVNLPYTP